MSVPETAVHEKHGPEAGEDDVRPARQMTAMEPETETERMKTPAQGHLRFRVGSPNPSHDLAADLGGNDIRHMPPSSILEQAW